MKLPKCLLILLNLLVSAAAWSGESGEVARLIREGWRHRVWLVYPPEKIKADQELPREPRIESIQISAALNEFEPFVLVLRTELPLRNVELAISDLRGPQGAILQGKEFDVRRVGYVFVDEPSGTRIPTPMPYETGTGWYPDPLVRGAGLCRPNRNLQFWVTAHVSPGLSPGRYEGQVEIRYRKDSWIPEGKLPAPIQLPFTLQVRSFALPETSPLRNTAFFNPDLPHGKASDPEWLHKLDRDFVAHRQAPEPILPSPVVKLHKDGTLEVDASQWEQVSAQLLEELHLPHVFLPVWSYSPKSPMQGVYFLWHYPAVTNQWWFGAKIAGEDRHLTADFKLRFGTYLAAMDSIIKRRGWAGRVFLTTMDEPYTYHTGDRKLDVPENNYEVVRNFVAFVREKAPNLRTFVTADPVPELNGQIDHWCLRNLRFAAAARERAAKHGEVFTFCDNYRSFIDFPAVAPRSLGWLAWKLGAQGWLTYETMGGLNTAWESPGTVIPQCNGPLVWGMGQMFYPEPAGTGLIPSLRWEMMREGCDDYEYLWLLRERVKALTPSRQNEALVSRARAILDSAADAVVGGTGDLETSSASAKPNAQSNRVPHRLREEIAELLEALPKSN